MNTNAYIAVILSTVLVAAACGSDGSASAPADIEPGEAGSGTPDLAFSGIDCSAVAPVSFADQELPQPEFVGDLRCSDFSGASLAQPDFAGADITGATFDDVVFSQAEFNRAIAIGASFDGAVFAQSSIVDSDLTGADMLGAEFVDVTWVNTLCPDGTNSDDHGSTCEGSLDPAPVSVVIEGQPTTGSASAPSPAGVEPGRTACAGIYTGVFDGDDTGPFVIRVDDNGDLWNAFITAESVDIDLTGVTSVAQLLDDLDLTLGTDVIVDGTTVEIAPSALRVGPEGVQLGTAPIDLDRVGVIDESGQVTAIAQTGALVTGSFDWGTCTGAGNWVNGGFDGTWRVGLNPTAVNLGAGDCDGGQYVGGGVETGGVTVDLDAACVSSGVAAADPGSLEGDITVARGEGFTAYTLREAVLFEFGSAGLTGPAVTALELVAGAIEAEGGTEVSLLVIGHTDAIGSSAYNLDLSERRAESVRDALGDQLPGADISTVGLGESQPVAPNANPDGTDNPSGRSSNRRVEIVLTTG